MVGPLYIASDIYRRSSYGGLHPLRILRVPVATDLARALGWLPEGRYRRAPRARAAALTGWHTADYVAALQAAEATGAVSDQVRARHQIGTATNPLFPEIFSRPATGVGGVLLAADLLAAAPAGVVHVPGGGTHHGLPDRANGFCYLNDIVLGIRHLRARGLARVAYLDLDAHHCDGVEAGFAGDPSVRMISVHEGGRWPFTGRIDDTAGGSAFNLPVPAGLNDSEMRAILHELILPRLEEFRPQVLVVQAGADSLREDPLSRLALSNRAYLEVLQAVRGIAPRLLLLGGGGYNPWSTGRLWCALWGELSGQSLPDHPDDRLPPGAEAVLRGLDWRGGARPPPDEALMTTLIDPAREGPVRPEIREALKRLSAR